MSRAVIRSNSDSDSDSDFDSDSAGLTINPADPADSADSADFAAAAVFVVEPVPDLVDDLPSLALLTGVVLYSLDLGSFAHLLLVYLSYFFDLLFLAETVLAFLMCLVVLQIPYRPVKTQARLQILT